VQNLLNVLKDVPDYIKRSPRWKQLQEMNKDIEHMSFGFVKYNDFL